MVTNTVVPIIRGYRSKIASNSFTGKVNTRDYTRVPYMWLFSTGAVSIHRITMIYALESRINDVHHLWPLCVT